MQVIIDDLIGKKFADGGRGPDSYDCWGLVCEVFRRYGIELPDYRISCEAKGQIDAEINLRRRDWRRCDPQNPPIPSLLVFRMDVTFCNHTGVYLGNGRFIHTLEKTECHIERLDHPFWKQKLDGIYIPGWLK